MSKTPMSKTPTTINRTLIVALGDQGLAILQAFQTRLAARYATSTPTIDLWPVASLALTMVPENTGAIPTICLASSDAGRSEIWAALDDQIGELTTNIVQALARISQVPHGIDIHRGLRSPGIDVYLIAGLDEPPADILIDLAYLVRHLIRQRLNTHACISGLLLLPDPLTSDEPELAMARTYAVLEALDSYMASSNGYHRSYADGQVVEGWGPPFDGSCFLIGALNREGLHLERPQAREHLVAEALLQFITGALGPRLLVAEPMLRVPGRRPGYAGLGLACLVYPARTTHERLSRRLAREILATWAATSGSANLDGTRVAAFLTERGFNPTRVRQRLLPPELLAEAGVGYPIDVEKPWEQLDMLREALDETTAQRLAVLDDHRPQLEQTAEALARDLSDALGEHLSNELDHPQPAELQRQLSFVRALKWELFVLTSQEAEEAEARRVELQTLRAEADALGEELAELGRQITALRPTTLRAACGLLLHPGRWLRLWRLWQALQRTKMRYIAHLELQVEWTVRIMETELLVHYLQQAASRVEGWEQRLSSLLDAVQTAIKELEGQEPEGPECMEAEEPGGMGECPPAPLHNPGFDLEWSVLTPDQVEALYRGSVAEPAEELRAFARTLDRLPVWAKQPPGASAIREAALDYARHRLLSVVEVTVGQMLVRQYPGTKEQREALEVLFNAAVPFIAWDETTLHVDEGEALRETAILGAPTQDIEFITEILDSPLQMISVVPLGDPHRIVVLRVVQGIPLAAIPFVREAAACCAQAPGRARLHGGPSRVRLPDASGTPVLDDARDLEEVEG